jgi:opacity protein-like surface antigen
MEIFIKKALSCVIIALFSALTLTAQDDCTRPERHDVGIAGGATFYMGDLGDNYSFFRHLSYYGGLLYRYNFNEYYALRGQVNYGNLTGDVTRSDFPPYRSGRPWAFSRPVFMGEVIAEIGFLPLNVMDLTEDKRISPYLMGGVGVAALSADKNISYSVDDEDASTSAHLLLGVGVKWVALKRLTIGAEWAMRKTFSDKIDYVTGQPGSPLINNDWIGTLGVTITYRLVENRLCAAYQRYQPKISPLKGKTL